MLAVIATPRAAAGLTIDGTVARTMTDADLAALPRTTIDWAVHGKTLRCTGARLSDVLARAGVPAGEAVRGPALTTVVVARAADGYRAAFTLGELDPLLGNARIIVADTCNGAKLPDADGPLRLVASGDTRGARSVRQLVRLTVGPAAD